MTRAPASHTKTIYAPFSQVMTLHVEAEKCQKMGTWRRLTATGAVMVATLVHPIDVHVDLCIKDSSVRLVGLRLTHCHILSI